jgi:2'-5' RNA ligase
VRLFVALDPSAETRAQVGAVRDALAARVAAADRLPRVTWVAEQAAHVTLRFIGEVSDDLAARVRSALVEALPVSPYELRFAGVGAFPTLRRPRALWLGTEGGDEQTERLVRAVDARLDPILGHGQSRRFRAHLTVGRVKEPAPFDWAAAVADVKALPTSTFVDHVTLYQSRTSPKGPTYTALCVTPLA